MATDAGKGAAVRKAPMSRREVEEKIVALAWKDDGFRRKFLADPKQQCESHLGTKLPATLKIAAYQEDENNLHFVIPMKPANLGELSDEDLEKVAGGADVVTTIVVTVIASAGLSAVGGAIGQAAGGWVK